MEATRRAARRAVCVIYSRPLDEVGLGARQHAARRGALPEGCCGVGGRAWAMAGQTRQRHEQPQRRRQNAEWGDACVCVDTGFNTGFPLQPEKSVLQRARYHADAIEQRRPCLPRRATRPLPGRSVAAGMDGSTASRRSLQDHRCRLAYPLRFAIATYRRAHRSPASHAALPPTTGQAPPPLKEATSS